MLTKFEHTKIVNECLIQYGDPVWIDDFVLILPKEVMFIGDFVHIAAFTSITGDGSLSIGDYTGISYGCRILLNNDDFLGDAGLNNPTVPKSYRGNIKTPLHTSIGRHVLIGANSVIMPGVTIGDGCAIGANSFVNSDCEPWTIYAGSPALPIKLRKRSVILSMENKMKTIMECAVHCE